MIEQEPPYRDPPTKTPTGREKDWLRDRAPGPRARRPRLLAFVASFETGARRGNRRFASESPGGCSRAGCDPPRQVAVLRIARPPRRRLARRRYFPQPGGVAPPRCSPAAANPKAAAAEGGKGGGAVLSARRRRLASPGGCAHAGCASPPPMAAAAHNPSYS